MINQAVASFFPDFDDRALRIDRRRRGCCNIEAKWRVRSNRSKHNRSALGVGCFRLGRLAQLVRAPALQAGGRRFESCTAHQVLIRQDYPKTVRDWVAFATLLPVRHSNAYREFRL